MFVSTAQGFQRIRYRCGSNDSSLLPLLLHLQELRLTSAAQAPAVVHNVGSGFLKHVSILNRLINSDHVDLTSIFQIYSVVINAIQNTLLAKLAGGTAILASTQLRESNGGMAHGPISTYNCSNSTLIEREKESDEGFMTSFHPFL